LGSGFQAVVALTGLVLTPFLLGRLGDADFGRWLVVGQVLGLLGLLDLGVTAILPREVARAGDALPDVVRRAGWLVWLQTPAVALAAAAVWWAVTCAHPALGGPLAVILGGFVAQFPLRVPAAVLTGLQDQTFTTAAAAAGWAVTTALTVGLVLAGAGLYALAAGWAAGQVVGAAACWVRLRSQFPQARAGRQWPGRAALAAYLGPSGWATVRQAAQLLLNGTELIVLGWLAGPAAVVVYACTVKLVGLVNNQPYQIAILALPAIAELQAAGDRARLWGAFRALGLGLVVLSGGLGVGVLAVNGAFVPAWVGAARYGGPGLTALAVAVMTARHLVFTLGQTAYALGYDRQTALAGVADGLVTVGATAGWVVAVGLIGVPLGSLTGLVLTNGLMVVRVMAREEGVSPARALRWAAPWAARFALVGGAVAAAAAAPAAGHPAVAAGLATAGLAAYAAACRSLFARDPLRPYRDQAVAAVRRRLGLPT
jgi:O-antigen/teichoic acid export membrane protein